MDLFHLLGGGAKFDKKRFRDDLKIFEPAKREHFEIINNDAEQNNDLAKALLREIDFFSGAQPAEPYQSHCEGEASFKSGKTQNKRKFGLESENHGVSIFLSLEDVTIFRKLNRIRVYGTDIPNPFRLFAELSIHYKIQPFLQKNLTELKFDKPTAIQMQAMPIMLQGRDIIACAPTGSGKTLAYILPILHHLKGPEKIGYRVAIIAPTRELAQQIYYEIKKLSMGRNFKICVLTKATAATQAQNSKLRQKFDILISTPLRLVHAIQQDHLELSHVQHLILDEADKLLELGFLEQTDEIFAACSNPKLQKSMFSATIPAGVESLGKSVMKDPIRVVIGVKNTATDTIKQSLCYVGQEEGKLVAIRQIIQTGLKPPTLIFVQSIERAKELFRELVYDGINVDVIHSERTKAQRDIIVSKFKTGQIWVLISTELMARGLDFKGVNLVINYDFPQTVQSYIHRIGRTGRAGRAGEAITYFTNDDAPYLKTIVNVMRESGCEVPEWMLSLRNTSKTFKKNLKRRPIARKSITTTSLYDKKVIAHKKEIIENEKKRQKFRNIDGKMETSRENKKAKLLEDNK